MSKPLDFGVAMRKLETDAGESTQNLAEISRKILHLAQISGVEYKRLMYGEWLANECTECKSQANVHFYRQRGIHPKRTMHLCDSCAREPLRHAAITHEWEPGDE